MTSEAALAVITNALQAVLALAAPALLAALVAGILVGLVQTIFQVNEGSVSFVVKVIAIVAVFAVLGPSIGTQMVDYTKKSLESIEHVVKR